MANIKEQVQEIIETCRRLYEDEGMSAVFKHVFEGMEAKLPLYDNIEYKQCKACENECPSIIDICLVCGQSLPLQNVQFPTECSNGMTDSEGNVIMSEGSINDVPKVGEQINTIAELREFIHYLGDEDQVVIETIDTETGDVQDLYNMHIDVIDGIELTDGRVVSEIRFCQRPHEDVQQPSEEAKETLVNFVIDQLKKDFAVGDYTVLDELLHKLPWEILKGSLPEEHWDFFNRLKNK